MSLLGIDLGTSGTRAAAFSETGELLSEYSVPISLSRTANLVETDAEAVLTAVYEAASNVATSAALLNDHVAALSFSVQGETVVPVDAQGMALASAPVSMDRRGTHAALVIGDQLGHAKFQRITGQPLHPMFSIFKIAAGLPGWTDGVTSYLTLDAFISRRLGAAAVTDYSMAARTGAFDVNRLSWSDEILAAAESTAGFAIAPRQLPETVATGTIIGRVSVDAAQRLNLPTGTPIVAGLHDQAASFVGAGGRRGGPSVYALGSSDCLTAVTAERPGNLAGTGFASYPLAESGWVTLAGTAAGGWALDWFARLVDAPIATVFDAPSDLPPALLVLPYLAGSGTLDNDPSALGVVAGLTLATRRDELARAFLESTGYELAKIATALETRGIDVGTIRAVGTGSGSARALQIRASAADRQLVPVPRQSSARGAALLAGIGIGVFTSLDEVPDSLVGETVRPDPSYTDWYAMQRDNFANLFLSTSSTVHKLSNNRENRACIIPSTTS